MTSEVGRKPAECGLLEPNEETVSMSKRSNCVQYFCFKMYWKFKIPISQETFSFSPPFFTETSHGTESAAARWRHLSLSACGVISSHFLTWQSSYEWHIQHHLENQEIQSGWQHHRWAWSNPSWQILIQEIRENGGYWAYIPRCYREFFGGNCWFANMQSFQALIYLDLKKNWKKNSHSCPT